MIYDAFLGIYRCEFLFYDSTFDLMLNAYKSAEYDKLERNRATNLPHTYVLYV